MAEPSLEFKLDEDFLFILNFARTSIYLFKDRPIERALIESWFEKLCLEIHRGIDNKRLRNLYLVKLVTCIQSGILLDPFLAKPPPGSLEVLPQSIAPSNLDEPPWLKAFETEAAAAAMGEAGMAKDFSSYFCSKQLDDGRGLCAYLAVSVADEGEKPRWFEMGSGKPLLLAELDEEIEQAFQQFMAHQEEQDLEESGGTGEYGVRLLEAMRKELAGQAAAGDDVYLDNLLLEFEACMANKSMGRELEGYNQGQKRAFMVGYLEKKLSLQLEERGYIH